MMRISKKEYFQQEHGFTFIELILVIVMIGILASMAAQKMIGAAEQAEITAEDRTIDIMRNNIVQTFSEDLINGKAAEFPDDPFVNLSKVPEGYDRRRSHQPTGEDQDAGVWMFDRGSTTGDVTPEQAGTTLATFVTTGFIYHQRRDNTIVKWPYDSGTGVIGKKIIVEQSEIKERRDREKLERGETIEAQRQKTR